MTGDPRDRDGERPGATPGAVAPPNGRTTELASARHAPHSAPGHQDEQSLAEGDQTASDTDQTLSEVDHSASESDQTSADRDQVASDSDQAASDRDLSSAANWAAHEFSRGIRRRSTEQREQTARERLRVAEQRDATARARDLAALARDRAAEARDEAMAELEAADQHVSTRALTGLELIARAAEQRKQAAQHRAQAADHRLLASQDRQAAARDREHAAAERNQAMADRKALAIELERAAVDGLTGARTRAAGLEELEHELERARRTSSPLSVAYIDVVGLKAVNDTQGHATGDALLKRVVAHIKAHVRPYDLIIRLGGDEFLCVMPNQSETCVRERFAAIAAGLNSASKPGAIRAGFGQLRDDETASELVERADSELIRAAR